MSSSSQTGQEDQKTSRCPNCRKEFQFTTIKNHKAFPFCSDRCRDIDLGHWIREDFVISTPLLPKLDMDPETLEELNEGFSEENQD